MPPLDPATARARFKALARGPEEAIDLALGALLIAAEAEPVDVEDGLLRLDGLAELARPAVLACEDEAARVGALTGVLFGRFGLRGNLEAYEDPANSYLHRVLERGLGIPITLALVLVEVGRRVGVPLLGVGFPGHFLVRHRDLDLVLDPFDRGRPLTPDDLRALLRRAAGQAAELAPELLAPARPREVLARMLRNLLAIHMGRRDLPAALGALERLVLLDPTHLEAVRDRGLLRLAAGQPGRAARDLARYLRARPDGPDARAVRAQLDLARQRSWSRN